MDEQETQKEVQTESPEVHAQPDIAQAPVTGAEVSSTPKKQWSMKNNSLFTTIIALIILVVAVGAGAYVWHQRTSGSNASALGTTSYPAVVAVVNGENITGSDLQKSVVQTQNVAQQQGADLTDPKVQAIIQSQAISLLVNAKLLEQAATKIGITASSGEIDAQYKAIEDQFGGADKLAAQMKTDDLTEADLRDNIKQQTLIKAYLATEPSYANATVTDADVATAYATYKAQSTSTPPLEEISDQIKEQLLEQKQQDAINSIIDALRASSTIKMNV